MSDGYELAIERLIDAPIDAVWRAYTEHLAEWWCPKPWTVEIIEHDWRAGGRSAIIMKGPDGEELPLEGVFLEVSPKQRVVFTDAFRAGWIPQGPFMVGFMEFAPEGDKTRYRAGGRHWSADTYKQHKTMGFEAGWSKVAEQLEEVARRLVAA